MMTEDESVDLMGVLPLPDLVRRVPHAGIDLSENASPAVWDSVSGPPIFYLHTGLIHRVSRNVGGSH